MGRGILHRLVTGERTLDEAESILAHLRALLNTHQGESVTAPDFGVRDLTNVVHQLPEGIGSLEDSIRRTIEAHEPRLAHVRVRHYRGVDPLVLHFRISGRLASNGRRALQFDTRLEPGGRFHLSAG